MKDEFNRVKETTYNKKIREFKRFEAVEYYKVNEIKKMPPEIKKFKEGFNDKSVPEHKEIKNQLKEQIDAKKDNNRQENLNNNTNNIQGQEVEAGATTTTTAASVSSTASSVVSSAALTSGVSIISAVAVVAAVGAAIIKESPDVKLLKVETGTDYIYYELDVSKLAKKESGEDKEIYYKVKVYNGMFEEEYDILEEGIQKGIVSGLTPNRLYTISVIAGDDEYGYFECFSTVCYTNKEEMPKAVFDITPYAEGEFYNVEYNIFISDHAEVGYQTYIEIYYDDKLVLKRDDLDENNYFKGYLEDVSEGTNISMLAYTYYYDELTKIGEFGYLVTYPEYMQEASYQSSYDLKDPLITTSDLGYVLNIDTGFVSKKDNEGYVIDVYKTGEITEELTRLTSYSDEDLVESVKGNTKEISITVPGNLSGVEVYFTPIKENETSRRTYEKKLIGTYSFAEYRKQEIPKASITFTDSNLNNAYSLNYQVDIQDTFIQGKDYYVEVYKNDKLLKTSTVNTKTYVGNILGLYNEDEVTVKLYATVNDEVKEIASKNITISKSVNNPVTNAELNLYDGGYYLGFDLDEGLENVIATTTITYDDEVVNQFDTEVTGRMSLEGSFAYNDLNYEINNVKSIVVHIKSGDTLIKELVYDSDDAQVNFDDYQIDSSANVTIPYSVSLSNDQVFKSLFVEFESGSSGYSELETKNGNVIINDLNSSNVKYNAYLYYENNGFKIQKPFSHSFDLSVEVDMDYYATYINSQAYAFIKLNAKVNDVVIEDNIDTSFLKVEKDNSDNPISLQYVNAELTNNGYYQVSIDEVMSLGYVKIKPNNNLFVFDNPYVVSFDSIMYSFDMGSSYVDSKNAAQFGEYNLVDSEKEMNYVHTTKDGKNYYYIYTNLDLSETEYGSYYQMIYYTYKDSNDKLRYGSINIGTETSYEFETAEDIISFNYSLVSDYANYYVDSSNQRVSPESLSLYEYQNNSYVASSDTYFDKNKKYYISSENSYVLANPTNLNLYILDHPTFELTDDEEYTGSYFYYDEYNNKYVIATPSNQYLYVYNNGYELATSDSFETNVAYYKELPGGGYTSVKPKDLGLYEYNEQKLVKSTDEEFKYTPYEINRTTITEATDEHTIIGDVFYYDTENEKTIIGFVIDNNRTNSESVSVTLGDNDYSIELKSAEEVLQMVSPLDIKTYEVELNGGSATVSVYMDEEEITKYRVDIALDGNLVEYPINSPVVTYNFYPKMVLKHFDVVQGKEDTVVNKEFVICKNTITHSSEAIVTQTFYEDTYYLTVGYEEIEGLDVNNFIVYAYSDEACTNLITSVQNAYQGNTVSLEIPNSYSVVYIKIEFVKNSNGHTTLLEKQDIGIVKFDCVDNVNIQATDDGISFSGTLNSSNLRYEILTEHRDDKPSRLEGDFEESEFDLMASIEENGIAYVLNIYDKNTDELLKSYTYSDFIEVNDYEYVDETDYITLPYQIHIPEGYEIQSGSVTYLDDDAIISDSNGSINITRLDSNIIQLQFNLVLVDANGHTVNYQMVVEKEFEITGVDFDYDIVGYNSSEYSYTQGYAVYDTENDKYYTYRYDEATDSYVEFTGSGDYYDKDGNKAPEVDDEVVKLVSVCHMADYALSGRVVAMVGPLKFDNTDYVINVTKSGADFLTNVHTIPTISADSYSINGSEVTGEILIPMLHHGLDVYQEVAVSEYRTDIYQQVSCEVELEIVYGGKTYTKQITYNPPIYYPNANNCFGDSPSSEVTKNEDDTLNLYLDTKFDTSNPNIRYKIFLYDASNLKNDSVILEESDYLDSSEYTFTNIPNKAYTVYVKVYYYEDGIYTVTKNESMKSLGKVNTAIESGYISYDFNTSKYAVEYMIKENMVDRENGSATLNIKGVDYEVSLQDGEYELGTLTATVETLNGRIYLKVSGAASGSALDGTITLNETIDGGNTYDTKTYSVSY